MKASLFVMVMFLAACTHHDVFDETRSDSMIRVLAHPQDYHGKLVTVSGYLHAKFEDSALYLSKESADHLDGQNALWVVYAEGGTKFKAYFDCKYVTVTGTFDKDFHGHLGCCAGGLRNVSSVAEQTEWYDGSKEIPH